MSPSVTRDIPLGTVLRETYEIVGVLGRGGMGTVFLANHLRLPGRQVAIKVLRNDAGLGKDVFVRFRREAEIASRLGHPNIVEVLDFDHLPDGSPFLVMECLRGQPLSRRLRRGPLTLDEVLSIARQMGSALQATHHAGIVHRDLKPGNVFLTPTEVGGVAMEHVKLLDFGISKVIDSHSVNTQGGILLGTPQYMAPEQAQGKNQEVDPRTDIFSFGCMVYEMLARRLPFKDGPLPELIYRIVYDPPDRLESLVSGVPVHVVVAIDRALEKRPEARYPDVGSFILDLTGMPLQAISPGLSPMSAMSVRPSQIETVGSKGQPVQGESVSSRSDTVSYRRGAGEAGASGSPGSDARSAKRPVVNVQLHEVSTMDEGARGEGSQPRPDAASPPGPSTEAVRPGGGVAQGAPSFLETRRSRKWWWAVAAVLLLIGAGAVALKLRPVATGGAAVMPGAQGTEPRQGAAGTESAPTLNAGAASEVGGAPSGTVPSQPADAGLAQVASPRPDAAPTQAEPPGTAQAQPGGAQVKPAPSETKGSSPAIPEAALADLMAAERALTRGDTDEALHLARRSQRVQVTGTSFSLLARAHCRQKDISNARTAWERVPAWERTKVRRYCNQYDIAL